MLDKISKYEQALNDLTSKKEELQAVFDLAANGISILDRNGMFLYANKFFQKYIEHFPTGGQTVLFDRSWYNRAMVEPVFGFCTDHQYEIFMEDVVNFERDLVRQDIILVKLYFSVSKEEQQKRFESRRTNPLKQWKLSEVDLQAQDLWDEFSEKKYEMLKRTHSKSAPWNIVRSDDKHRARMEAIKIVLNSVDYEDRNYALNFEPAENINISVQKELTRMRKKRDY